MSDLISREAAIKMVLWGGCTAAALANLVALPIVDAEPVRHGKWINVCEMLPPEYHDNKRCSVCANFALHDRLGRIRMSCYCPNCGAKMDLEDDQP